MKIIFLLLITSLVISQPITTRDKVIALETEIKNIKEQMIELKKDQKSAEHTINQYYHKIYVEDNRKHKEHQYNIMKTRDAAETKDLITWIIQGLIGAGVLGGFWRVNRNGKGANRGKPETKYTGG